jgi:aconitate hydratase 2/2-methylisocitrate dehydratase
MSTSTRNFPNRLGLDTQVYLGSAELASVCAMLGRIPTKEEYMANIGTLDKNAAEVYRYMNFDKIKEFSDVADTVSL